MESDPMPSPDTRSSMAKAMDLVSQITTISLMGCLPALAGFGIDRWLGTKLVFILLGLILGLLVAAFQLMKLVKRLEAQSEADRQKRT